jgi:hypothetical protein
MVVLNKNIKIIINYVAGPLIMIFLFYTVATQLQKQPHWRDSLARMVEAALGKEKWKLYSMILLMGVNWGLETSKWRIAMKPVQAFKFTGAFKAVLAGTSIASFTPNRIGEYLGRMLYVEPGNKLLSVAPTILCSMAQMLVTLSLGTVGLYFFSSLTYQFPVSWLNASVLRTITVVTAISGICLGLIYFRFDPLVERVNRWLKKNQKIFYIPQDYSFRTLVSILLISVLRYGVFILQYFLLYSMFGITLSGKQVFTGVSVMFVVMAIVPTLTFLTDLGFRWAAGIQIFSVYTTNTAGILAVSLGIWLINLIIPALIGSLLILRIKLFRSR